MRTIRHRLGHATMLGLSLGLAACAGRPVNTSLRPTMSRLDAASSTTKPAPSTIPDTTVSTRVDAPPTEERRYASVDELLSGRVAGLTVIRNSDGTVSMRVRGLGPSFNDAEPLVVVDGMMLSTASQPEMLSTLSSMQIRRIEVLKDIAATSIYGTRGSHGVVLITTRASR
jgi:TonB-dependent SusC/RagA subfamily outer membrane receptor